MSLKSESLDTKTGTSGAATKPFSIVYRIFTLQMVLKYAIWVYLEKYLNIAILFRISPRFQKWYRKFIPTLFHWAARLRHFIFKNDLADFLKMFPRLFNGPFLYRKTYSLKYWTRLPSVGQSGSPSVPLSVSLSIGIFSTASGSGLVLDSPKKGQAAI